MLFRSPGERRAQAGRGAVGLGQGGGGADGAGPGGGLGGHARLDGAGGLGGAGEVAHGAIMPRSGRPGAPRLHLAAVPTDVAAPGPSPHRRRRGARAGGENTVRRTPPEPVFPPDDPTAPGSSFPSGQWLAGAGRTSLLLSPQSMSLGNQSPSGIPVTLTAVDVRGTEVARIAGVRELRPDRTAFVFTSSADAARRAVEPPSAENDPYPYDVEVNLIPLDQLAP